MFLRPFGSKRLLASPSASVKKNLFICYSVFTYVLMFFCLKNNLFICLREAEDQ